MDVSRNIMCCGLREINGLSHQREYDIAGRKVSDITVKDKMLRFCKLAAIPDQNFSHAVFSQAGNRTRQRGYGEEFAAFILKNKLGHVAESIARVNPNSGNKLKVWVWTLSKAGLKKWYAAAQKASK